MAHSVTTKPIVVTQENKNAEIKTRKTGFWRAFCLLIKTIKPSRRQIKRIERHFERIERHEFIE